MQNKNNKVKYNLKNVHVAIKTAPGTYNAPFAVPGAVNMSLSSQGGLEPFYADGIKYYVGSSNNGYEGDIEMAMVPDKFRIEVLKEFLDDNSVLWEDANAETVEFALGFTIDGDVKGTMFWFYGCTATRPSVDAQTTEDKKTPQTDKITISCAGDDFEYKGDTKRLIRAKSTESTTTDVTKWFEAVVTPAAAVETSDAAVVTSDAEENGGE